ncbi:MAG: YicC family protein [Clostridiales bacterium]|nr:YicC/YloC family endoribonuclease [Bacillota bacterium]NLL53852.1 YicC family protein [Clostridiales bacterium]
MRSMTGYGRSMVRRDGRELTVELKSVNHRFLDIYFRMPRFFGFAEDTIRKLLSSRLSRGHVDVFMTYRNLREDARAVRADRALYLAYAKALEDMIGMCGSIPDDRSLMKLAMLPDVLVVTEAEEDLEALNALIAEAVTGALDILVAMREREGESLKEDLSERLARLEQMRQEIGSRYPDTVKEYEERLRQRIEELLDVPVDQTRLLQEVAIMADRSAISEELVRLDSHFAQMREMLENGQAVGRKLDFLVQELNREVNTISSKSQDIHITRLVVAGKAEIEKIREQTQNVE